MLLYWFILLICLYTGNTDLYAVTLVYILVKLVYTLVNVLVTLVTLVYRLLYWFVLTSSFKLTVAFFLQS